MPKTPKAQEYSSDSESDSSSSSSSSSSQVKIVINKKHSKHYSESDSSRTSLPRPKSPKRSKSPKRPKSPKSECSTDTDFDKCSFDEIYQFYKCKLLQDENLMVGGSDAYAYAYNNIPLNTPTTHPVDFNSNGLQYNVEHKYFNAPFVVRTSGVYIVFFCANTDQAAQYTLFINGLAYMPSTTGNNAGAGQTVFRQIIKLNKNDTLIMRNYSSAIPTLTSQQNVGGLQTANNNVFLLAKIAALPKPEYECVGISNEWKKCLSRRKKYLFKKLGERLLCDKELMVKGFNIQGTFYSSNAQTVTTESEVIFDTANSTNTGLGWAGSQVIIQEDGIYKTFFFANTSVAAQFSFAINGIPYEPSTQGSNRGAGQISIRTLLELKSGDVITVKNHTSANGSIGITTNNGGSQIGVNCILTMFKLAPLCKAQVTCCKKTICGYEEFRSYLLSNKCFQLAGSSAYIGANSSHEQDVPIGAAFDLEYDTINKDVEFAHGVPDLMIKKSGIYDIFVDIITDQPAQLTLFVNGLPDQTTTTGRDSGANRSIMRQFVRLNAGDVINVRNWESHAGMLTTNLVTGGTQPGHPVKFMVFLLSELDNDSELCCLLPPGFPCLPGPPGPSPCPPGPEPPEPEPHESEEQPRPRPLALGCKPVGLDLPPSPKPEPPKPEEPRKSSHKSRHHHKSHHKSHHHKSHHHRKASSSSESEKKHRKSHKKHSKK